MVEEQSILIVEDNGNDVALIRRSFKQSNVATRLHVLTDGDSAVTYLKGDGPYADRALPALMLLDLKLPRRSGLEVLQWMKVQPLLKRIPVIVLTSSKEHSDINRAYDLGANSYLSKPVEFTELKILLERLHVYWMSTNNAPDFSATA